LPLGYEKGALGLSSSKGFEELLFTEFSNHSAFFVQNARRSRMLTRMRFEAFLAAWALTFFKKKVTVNQTTNCA